MVVIRSVFPGNSWIVRIASAGAWYAFRPIQITRSDDPKQTLGADVGHGFRLISITRDAVDYTTRTARLPSDLIPGGRMPGDRTPMRQVLETQPLALLKRWSQREMSLFLGVSQRTASAHHRRFSASVLP